MVITSGLSTILAKLDYKSKGVIIEGVEINQ